MRVGYIRVHDQSGPINPEQNFGPNEFTIESRSKGMRNYFGVLLIRLISLLYPAKSK